MSHHQSDISAHFVLSTIRTMRPTLLVVPFLHVVRRMAVPVMLCLAASVSLLAHPSSMPNVACRSPTSPPPASPQLTSRHQRGWGGARLCLRCALLPSLPHRLLADCNTQCFLTPPSRPEEVSKHTRGGTNKRAERKPGSQHPSVDWSEEICAM